MIWGINVVLFMFSFGISIYYTSTLSQHYHFSYNLMDESFYVIPQGKVVMILRPAPHAGKVPLTWLTEATCGNTWYIMLICMLCSFISGIITSMSSIRRAGCLGYTSAKQNSARPPMLSVSKPFSTFLCILSFHI